MTKSTKPYSLWISTFLIISNCLTIFLSGFYFWNLRIVPESGYAWVFLLLYSIGHFGLLSLIFYIPLLLLTRLTWNFNIHRFLLPFLLSFGQTLLLIDSFIYSQYRFHINGLVLDLFIHGDGQIIHFNKIMWVWILLLALVLFLMNFIISEIIQHCQNNRKITGSSIFRSYICLVFIAYISSQSIHAEADAHFYHPITQLAGVYPLAAPARFAEGKSNIELFSKLLDANYNPRSKTENISCRTPFKPKNVLIIVIDSLRSDTLTSQVMPQLNQFAKKNLSFQNHFSGSNETRGGIFSLFYGLPPFFFEAARLQRQSPLLMDLFLKSNYEMGIFASAPLTRPEFDQTVFSQIKNLRLLSKEQTPSSRDQEIVKEWSHFLNQRSKDHPFLGFLFFDSLHAYDFPASYSKKFEPMWENINYFELNNDFNPTPFINRYKTSAHYVDSLLGQVFSILKLKKLNEDTIVIITSDHGQEFNDTKKNYWGHNSNFSPFQTKVPFVIQWPKQGAKKFIHRTSHYDLVPTLVEHLFQCAEDHKQKSWGVDLFDQKQRTGILMGYPNHFGIMLENKIIVANMMGNFEIVDFNYNKLHENKLELSLLSEVLSKLSIFNDNKSFHNNMNH